MRCFATCCVLCQVVSFVIGVYLYSVDEVCALASDCDAHLICIVVTLRPALVSLRVTGCLITFTVYKIAEKSLAARAPLPVV